MTNIVDKACIEAEQNSMLQAISCVISTPSAIYVSGPITTGRRFFEWFRVEGLLHEPTSTSYKMGLRKVIAANEKAIFAVAAKERQAEGQIVIEPASLTMPHWTQDDYALYWTRIIERFVSQLVVVDGWQYSVGCIAEFRDANRLGLPVRDQRGKKLTYNDGYTMMLNAARELEDESPKSEVLGKVIRGLRTFAG